MGLKRNICAAVFAAAAALALWGCSGPAGERTAPGAQAGGGVDITACFRREGRDGPLEGAVRLTAGGEQAHYPLEGGGELALTGLPRRGEAVDTDHIAALDRHTAVETISQIASGRADRGYVGHYRFRMFRQADGGSTIIGLDCFLQLQAACNMLRITILVCLFCALIVFVLLLSFSKKAIRPFLENLERQRQFVTDASHELKTPLAILSADMGLLADLCGESPWLDSAQAQISRLDRLIKDLVELARTEETVQADRVQRFSLSEIAQASADAFQSLAQAAGKALCAQIADGVDLRGVPDDLFRLFAILLDNAVKHCDPGGTIRFTLHQRGRTVYAAVSNPCQGLDPALLPRYFDRFYRADSSRARETGGYGIGLSTAKAIVARHRGHITDRYAGGVITFTAALPAPPAGA